VLLALDTDSVDATRGSRADGRYALAWCREWGRGRVFYTALGHGPDVWTDERFLTHLVEGVAWTLAGGPGRRRARPPRARVPALPQALVVALG
jgi:type 1 glutamine amidotransferase